MTDHPETTDLCRWCREPLPPREPGRRGRPAVTHAGECRREHKKRTDRVRLQADRREALGRDVPPPDYVRLRNPVRAEDRLRIASLASAASFSEDDGAWTTREGFQIVEVPDPVVAALHERLGVEETERMLRDAEVRLLRAERRGE